MENRQQIILACIIALMFLTPSTAKAQQDDFGRHNRTYTRLWEELNLTSEQKEKIAELHKETQSVRDEHLKKIKELRKQTRKELLKENSSETTLSELAKESGVLEQAYAENRNEHLLKIKEILTPGQFVQLIGNNRHPHYGEINANKRTKHNGVKGSVQREQDERPR